MHLVVRLRIVKLYLMDNLHIFLGATVADAAARPLHWVYDPKKLNQYIKGKKEIAFLKKISLNTLGQGQIIGKI